MESREADIPRRAGSRRCPAGAGAPPDQRGVADGAASGSSADPGSCPEDWASPIGGTGRRRDLAPFRAVGQEEPTPSRDLDQPPVRVEEDQSRDLVHAPDGGIRAGRLKVAGHRRPRLVPWQAGAVEDRSTGHLRSRLRFSGSVRRTDESHNAAIASRPLGMRRQDLPGHFIRRRDVEPFGRISPRLVPQMASGSGGKVRERPIQQTPVTHPVGRGRRQPMAMRSALPPAAAVFVEAVRPSLRRL